MVSGIALIGTVPIISRPVASKPSSKNPISGLVSKFVIESAGSSRKSFRSMVKGWPGIMVRDSKTSTKKLLT